MTQSVTCSYFEGAGVTTTCRVVETNMQGEQGHGRENEFNYRIILNQIKLEFTLCS